jgi:4-hydroxythreonine-4-phosphate dehydrogenase
MTPSVASPSRPVVALAMGDPAGISSELAARLLADAEVRSAARLVVFGDRRMLALGERQSGTPVEISVVRTTAEAAGTTSSVFVDGGHLDPATVTLGQVTKAGGVYAIANFRNALDLANSGTANAVCFTPFNKAAMRLAYPAYEDEIVFVNDVLGFTGKASEFNILDKLWNARVTSHVPLSAVAGLITTAGIVENLELTDASLKASGLARPRIAVAGLNPHAGDGGNFGHEDDAIIRPAVRAGQALGIVCDGPFPPDTVFVRAWKGGQFDAVLTMYHDQGQIAMKLIGFDSGVTLLGGYPFPICTPAHGTAYDIAGQGAANIGASKAAVLLAARMATAAKSRSA